MLLSVVIPCFNERDTIEQVLRAVRDAEPRGKEVIVVDDCSGDGTRQILERLKKEGLIDKLLFHDKNRGKGSALATGLRVASGNVVVIQDADLEYNPAEYKKMIEPILKGEADVVYGSRFLASSPRRVLPFWHYVGNRVLTLFSNMLSNLNLTDMETCYKMFKREIIENINIEEQGFGVEPELTAKFARKKARIWEVSIDYAPRWYSEGKKIGWKDGVRALYCIVKYNIFRR